LVNSTPTEFRSGPLLKLRAELAGVLFVPKHLARFQKRVPCNLRVFRASVLKFFGAGWLIPDSLPSRDQGGWR